MNVDLINHIAATIRNIDGMARTQGSAGALAEAIVEDGLRTPAVLSHALYISFSDTELMALRVLIESASFQLSEADFALRLNKAIGEALAERES